MTGPDSISIIAVLGGIALLAFLFGLYFLPSWIAFSRRHHNAVPIFILNLLLGVTFVGWVIALVWALTEVHRPQPQMR